MNYIVLEKLKENPKYLEFLRSNSNWYKKLNRNFRDYDNFVNEMKIKYKLRTIDRIDSVVDSVSLITKIMSFKD